MATFLSRRSSDDPMGSETFASLWLSLQNSYEGTNITRTVARLLHMYQPEDGLEAYERLLQTLYVLLGDFDSRGFKLLVSIIPPPKEIPEDIIEEIFEKAVGFTRMTTLPDSRFLDFGTDDEDTTSQTINLEENPITEETIENLQTDFDSKSEISEQIDESPESSGASSDYRMKWISTPYTLRKNAICQSTNLIEENFKETDNQNIEDDEDDFCKIEDSSGVFKKPELVDVPKKRHSRRTRKKSPEMNTINSKNKEQMSQERQKKFTTLQNVIDEPSRNNKQSEKNLRRKLRHLQRAIQEDIDKMDIVQANSAESEIVPIRKKKQKFLQTTDFDINNNLSRSIENFLHRIKGEEETRKENIEKVQIITPSNNDPISDETAAFIDCWKKIITKSVLGRDPEPEDLCSTDVTKGKSTVTRKKGSTAKRENERKVNRKKMNNSKRQKREDNSSNRNENSKESENSHSDSLNNSEQLSNSDFNNIVIEESKVRSRSNLGNVKKNETELMDYRQYCDYMLSIQNTDEMSASSSREYDNNQYYFDYLQREYQLLEQRLSMGIALPNDSQFSHSSSISNHQLNTDSCLKSKSKNWNFPSFKQSQCPQHHRSTSAENSSVYNFVPEENVSIEIIDCEEHEFNQLANDPNVVQQNLEDIFLVVKDSENVSINSSTN
ncbi:protein PF14_0175-like isoform X1 [Leptopilina heterotoma]|uniref:protein PF14_0175-like isoform X1 n=1 Tax=Leptopilina heterotoma TaxID=63436 RepID=UPI001CA809B8|nr:protein PF14_0175-like isoform X1 [Leptopilina heterotoma]